MTWPSYYPNNCPCEDSYTIDCDAFRFIADEQPAPEDFKSHRELYPTKNFNKPECIVCGISIYLELDDAKRVQNRIPGLRKKKIARGCLTNSHGVVKNTVFTCSELSHHTWWIPVEVSPWAFFQPVAI